MIRNYNDPISFREHGQPPDPQGRPSRPLPAGFKGRPGVRLRLGHDRPQRLLGQVVQGRKRVLPVKKTTAAKSHSRIDADPLHISDLCPPKGLKL